MCTSGGCAPNSARSESPSSARSATSATASRGRLAHRRRRTWWNSPMQQTATDDHLEPTQSADVLALAVRAATHDGVRPLSEQTVLDVRRLPGSPGGESRTTHLLVEQHPDAPRPDVIAYAHVEHSEPPAAEIVVDPDHRHAGHGRALATTILERWPQTRFWAHGDLPAAKALFG